MILPTWFDHLRYVEDSFCYKEVQFEMFCPPVKPLALLLKTLGTFNKPQRQRRREHPQTKGLISRTMVLHMCFESWYISLPSSTKQQHEMTKFYVFWRKQTAMANFWYFFFELNAVGACLA